MPENYSVAKQVLINTIVFTYLPKYAPALGGILVLAVLAVFYRRRKRVSK
jgi:LPXTG-motif cell wall-anchored protein